MFRSSLKTLALAALALSTASCGMMNRQAKAPKVSCQLAAVGQSSNVSGKINFIQESDGVRVEGEVSGLAPGKHGIHIHEFGDCGGAEAKAAGEHFNPTGHPHGPGASPNSHEGDLGNLVADSDGRAKFSLKHPWLTLSGPKSIVGKSLIIHAVEDDLSSQPSGNSGARIACGVITSEKP
jgi:Cu-Zn family superoxide dismutase